VTAGTRAGAFALQSELGRGGMGAVWRAVHVRSGLPVAIKVVTAERAREPGFVAAFRAEARAVAGLDHPGIVRLLDYGELGDDVDGELVAGSPWMAMELGRGGTLQDVGTLDWPRTRRVALGLLDALAHAHARGVIHRDLKPANVLLASRDAGEPFAWDGSLQLLDFGLAHLGVGPDDGRTEADLAGTPWFMAPEQFRGAWRDYGPWTDLYALGCLLHALAVGQPPYRGDSIYALAFAHTIGPPAQVPVLDGFPAEFSDWLQRLIEREPADRFARAADAAAALPGLGDDEPRGSFDAQSLRLHAVPELWFGAATGPVPATGDATARIEAVDLDFDGPAFAARWRRPEAARPAAGVVDAGLGLLELRRPGLVGRDDLRHGLWSALGDVIESGRPRLLVLQGPTGSGRGALAGWLGERAHELGVATPVSVGPGEGLGDGVARLLGVAGRAPDAQREQIASWLAVRGADEEWAAEALARAVDSAGELSAAGRRIALGDALGRAARGRPLVLTVAEADPVDLDALLAVRAPLLILLVGDPVALPPGRVGTVSVPPLSHGERRALLRQLLPLDDALAARLGAASDGQPGLLRLLLAGLVEAGALEPGLDGFSLRAGATPSLPADARTAWLRRLDEAAADDGPAVELLAALGARAGLDEWAALVLGAGHGAVDLVGLLDRLCRRRLATATDGVQLAAPLSSALAQRARDAGRWAPARAAAAEVVPDGDERRPPMLADAGDPAAAVAFLEAARRRRARGEPRVALALLDRADRLGAPSSSVALERSWAHRFAGDLDAAQRQAERIGADAEPGERELALGLVAHARGEFDVAAAHCRAAADAGGPAVRAEAWQALADRALRAGRFDDADEGFVAAAEAWAKLGEPVREADCLRARAIAARRRGDADGARPLLAAAQQRYAAAGHRLGLGDCLVSEAELDRAAGRLAEAEAGYRAALRIQDEVGGAAAGLFPRINLGLVALARGDAAGSLAPLLEARAAATDRLAILGVVHAATLPGLLAAGRLTEAMRAAAEASRLLAETGTAESDAAAPAELAARMARADGHDELGRAAWGLALEQRRRLGQHERAEDLLRWAAGWAAEDPR